MVESAPKDCLNLDTNSVNEIGGMSSGGTGCKLPA